MQGTQRLRRLPVHLRASMQAPYAGSHGEAGTRTTTARSDAGENRAMEGEAIVKMQTLTVERTDTLGQWIRLRDGSYKCGNVKVAIDPSADRPYSTWFVYVLDGNVWRKVMPEGRQWGYGHQGQAKIGAALMTLTQRCPAAKRRVIIPKARRRHGNSR